MSSRSLEPERLDQDDVSPADRRRAYDGLDRLQMLSRTAMRLIRAARPTLDAKIEAGDTITWVDLACGSGRILGDVTRLGHRHYLMSIEGIGVDFSGESLAIAGENTERLGVSQSIRWELADLVSEPLPQSCQNVDVISCSLFLHHLTNDQIITVLRKAAASCRVLVVDDLRRTRLGLVLAHAAGRLVSRSAIVHEDGPISVRAALTVEELAELAVEAGLEPNIQTQWPQRMLLVAPGTADAGRFEVSPASETVTIAANQIEQETMFETARDERASQRTRDEHDTDAFAQQTP